MSGNTVNYRKLFCQEALDSLFPLDRANQFFEALFGDSDEGAYDIRLAFKENQTDTLLFQFELHQRPGKCLACNLTYGLPKVFSRHPIIDIKGVVDQLDRLLGDRVRCGQWQLGGVREVSKELHVIPLAIDIDQ
jgi:hypothetical protein